jgi:hypothetical protein
MIVLIRTAQRGEASKAEQNPKRKLCRSQRTILEDLLKDMKPATVYYEAVSL